MGWRSECLMATGCHCTTQTSGSSSTKVVDTQCLDVSLVKTSCPEAATNTHPHATHSVHQPLCAPGNGEKQLRPHSITKLLGKHPSSGLWGAIAAASASVFPPACNLLLWGKGQWRNTGGWHVLHPTLRILLSPQWRLKPFLAPWPQREATKWWLYPWDMMPTRRSTHCIHSCEPEWSKKGNYSIHKNNYEVIAFMFFVIISLIGLYNAGTVLGHCTSQFYATVSPWLESLPIFTSVKIRENNFFPNDFC